MRALFSRIALNICVCLIVVVSPVQAAGFDSNFFSQNNIIFYDPRCLASSSSDSVMQLAGNSNTEKILNFFMRKGLTLAQAAGIIGNMMQESGLNPAIIQGGSIADNSYTPVSGVGFGLVQWTSGDRQQKLVAYMKQMGVGMTDLSGQLGFAWQEMSASYPDTLTKLKATNDPVEAAIIVHNGYESSADSADTVRTVRGGNAQTVYNKYADTPALAGSTASSTMTPNSTSDASAPSSNSSSPDASSPGCEGGDGTALTGNAQQKLQQLTLQYAWHVSIPSGGSTTIDGKQESATDQMPAYTAAISKAKAEKRYTGGANGNDCGGFVTTLIHDSGFDTGYNSDKGNTVSQEAWLKQHWKPVDANASRQVGDVAVNEEHTYIYVGDLSSQGFKSLVASASFSDRAPMAGLEGIHDSSFRWYRKG